MLNGFKVYTPIICPKEMFITHHGIGKLNKFSKMPLRVMSRAMYNVAQNTATATNVTNVAMSEPNGVRPRQSRHTEMSNEN